MATALDVANYFLNFSDKEEDSGELLSNLKIQKLAYYAQGFSLAILRKPIFGEQIEAWTHGPVVPDLYHLFKAHGSLPIPSPKEFDAKSIFTVEEMDLLAEVYQVYGQFSAWKLRDMTHNEPPWKDNYPMPCIIPNEDLADYFATKLVS